MNWRATDSSKLFRETDELSVTRIGVSVSLVSFGGTRSPGSGRDELLTPYDLNSRGSCHVRCLGRSVEGGGGRAGVNRGSMGVIRGVLTAAGRGVTHTALVYKGISTNIRKKKNTKY